MTHELRNQSFLSTGDLSNQSFQDLVDFALSSKADSSMLGQPLLGKSVGLVFFNSSLRTRASMAVAVQKLGGYPLIMDVGGGVWLRLLTVVSQPSCLMVLRLSSMQHRA